VESLNILLLDFLEESRNVAFLFSETGSVIDWTGEETLSVLGDILFGVFVGDVYFSFEPLRELLIGDCFGEEFLECDPIIWEAGDFKGRVISWLLDNLRCGLSWESNGSPVTSCKLP